MKNSAQQYAEALLRAVEESNPKDADIIINNLVEILKRHHQTHLYPEIIEKFEMLCNDKAGIKTLVLETSERDRITQADLDSLNKAAKTKYKAQINVNSDIQGGVVIKLQDELYDASIKSKLNKLNQSLIQ